MKSSRALVIAMILGLLPVALAEEPSHDPREIGRILHSMVWTGNEVLVWGGGSEGMFFGHGLRIDPATENRRVMADNGAPCGRWGHSGVWTGTEMIVWGGRSQFATEQHWSDGARYNPLTDTWSPLSTANAPTARSQMAAVWTGEEMLVWGGFGDNAVAWNTGGRYNPRTNTWRPMSTVGAPQARVEPLYVWTGTELIVCGGITPDLKLTLRTGARYNPVTDSWTPMAFDESTPAVWGARAVWTGSEMIVWGGSLRNGDDEINRVTSEGAAYDPVRNCWHDLTAEGAPSARFFHQAIWTGKRMVVWGGGAQGDELNPDQYYNDGGVYDPVTNRWEPLSWVNGPSGRGMHAAVWTGRKMLIFGGSTGGFTAFSDTIVWEPR